MQRDIVSDGHPLPEGDGLLFSHAMEYAAVLDIRIGADANVVHVAADHSVHPYAGLLTQDDIPDNLSGFIYITRLWNRGVNTLIRANHSSSHVFVVYSKVL